MPRFKVVVRESEAPGGFAVKEVEGEPCTLPGYEDFSFCLHRTIKQADTGEVTFTRNYTVTDTATGHTILSNYRGSKAGAIKAATERMVTRCTIERLTAMQELILSKLSPELRKELPPGYTRK